MCVLISPGSAAVFLPMRLPSASVVSVTSAFLLHEMAHKFTAIKFGYWAEFRKDNVMLLFAVLLAALMIHGVVPGPTLISERPDIFWGVITSMYIGNVMLLVLNLPLIGLWVQITKVPFRLMFPIIILICIVGVYTLKNSVFDIWIMIIFGVIGYVMKKCQYEPAPLALAYVLGPMLEKAMRQSLIISNGSFKIFFLV